MAEASLFKPQTGFSPTGQTGQTGRIHGYLEPREISGRRFRNNPGPGWFLACSFSDDTSEDRFAVVLSPPPAGEAIRNVVMV